MESYHHLRDHYPTATASTTWATITLALSLVVAVLPAQAQFTISPLGTFGKNGWLAPNGYNGSTYTNLTTGDSERGLAYGNNHLYLVSRNGGDFIRILDAQTGTDLGALNLGSGIVSGGTFNINMVAVAADGMIYVANLAIGPTAFRVYRWTNDLPSTTPVAVYNGVPLAGARMGDSLAVIGSGSSTWLVAGFNSTPSVAGNNGYGVIDPAGGTATAVGFSSMPPGAGDFRLGICFTDASHVMGTQGGGGGFLFYTSFSDTNGTLLASPALASTDERPMSFAMVAGFSLMAALSTTDNHVSIYDLTDPIQPVLVGQANATSGTLPADAHNTGAVAWGKISGNTGTLYAMATDDGIQAFTVTVPAQTPAAITNQPQNQTVMELSPATFRVGASGVPVPTCQWYRGSSIPGATNSTFTIAAAAYNDNGTQFDVVVQNVIGNVTYAVTSSVVTLTVIADTNPPVLLSAQALGLSQVQVNFSKRISPSTGTNPVNYAITGATSGLVISNATLDSSQSNVVLGVGGMLEGIVYTLTVNNLEDQSAARNVIAPNSHTNFAVSAYNLSAIGNPAVSGNEAVVAGGYDIIGGGLDFGGASDQGSLSYQMRTGDFDVAIRLAGLSPSDVWAKAGLMARETLDPGSRFAAALATPAMVGSFFSWRATTNSASQSSGHSAVNYPNTWLRLKRLGDTFSGFASYDGQIWTQLGSAAIALPSQVYLGLAVSSHSASQPTTAQFRNVTELSNGLIGSVASDYESLGPCSRRTPLVISELMYNPARRTDGRDMEYVELYNSNPWWEDISGYRLTGDVLFTIPAGTILPGGGFLLVSPAPADLQSVYGITNVLGPSVPTARKTGLIQLRNEQDAIVLEFTYGKKLPWPAGADGTGHSIVLARPSYGEADPRAWTISDIVGGSPGAPEAYRPSPLRNVVINEFLAHPGDARQAYVELYNHSSQSVDISGCVLTDAAATNKFVVPTNTVIAAAGFVAFDQNQLGFALNPAGGLLLFKNPDGSRVLDAVTYEAQALNRSTGRWPDGATDFYPLAGNTPRTSNGDIYLGDIAINEIMYKPISGNNDDQYVELYNQGVNPVDLAGWRFTAGIRFTFSTQTVLAPGGYLVVARNLTNLFSHYTNLSSANTVGSFAGTLSHTGERLALARPDSAVESDGHGGLTTNTVYVVEDEVTYETGGRWGQWAHGGGSSLELINPRSNHRLAYNWADSDETAKSAWTNLGVTGLLDNGTNYSGSQIDLVQVGLLDVGECLLDNLEVRSSTNGPNLLQNGDFEAGSLGWKMQGDHARSSIETATDLGGYLSPQCLHVRSSDGIWTGANSVQGTLTNSSLVPGRTATLRLTGRWLRGSPEVLMRVHGNWIELTGSLPVPVDLGTPGGRNSRSVSNPGPAIFNVKHSPPIPPANQPVVVTARFHDTTPFQATLMFRIDTAVNPIPTYRSVRMVDDGSVGDAIAGDGLYSATIPAQPVGTVVAFIVQARDDSGAMTTFPSDLKDNSGYPREGVIRFGDTVPIGSFGQYHLWLTQNWINRWASFPGLANENNDATFVDGGGRIIYNMVGRFAGSPYHQYSGSPVTTIGGMHWTMPEDDKMLGSSSFNKQHVPGNGALDDKTLQREQASYWMARQLGLPWNYRRFYILYVNGNRHGPLMEDSQVPGGDMLKEFFPNDSNGFLYKNNAWFEFDANGQSFDNESWCTLNKYTTTIDGARQHKLARYRWNYWIRNYADSANNFTNVYALIDAANVPTSSPTYYTNMEALVDTEEWLRMSAIEHATGDWDSYTTQNQWNMYSYKPLAGKWTLLKWDWNITLGNSGSWASDGGNLFTVAGADSRMSSFLNYPPYLRAYLRAFKDIANGPMNTNNVNPVLDAKYAAFKANGLTSAPYNVAEPGANGLKQWIATMHNSLLNALTARGVASVTFAVNGSPTNTTGTNLVILTGSAPVEVKDIIVNGAPLPLTWTTVRAWQMVVPLARATNDLYLQAVDRHGNVLSNMTVSLEIINNNAVPAAPNPVAINEWMANNNTTLADPADGQVHDWFELYNPNFAIVDLSGYYLTDKLDNQTQWPIPAGTVMPPHGFLLVWADGALNSTDHDLHANFKLAKAGASIGLFDPQGNQVDSVTFGPQKADVSQGRWPDGSPDIFFMTVPTAKAPNQFINASPALAPLADQSAWGGSTVTFMASATDPNAPPQMLTFSLDSGSPAGATINPTNGLFTWTPSRDQVPSTNWITVRVTDNGVPPLSDSRTLAVVVQGINLSSIGLTANGQPSFTWATQPGGVYRIEWKAKLDDSAWQTQADLTATGATITFTDQNITNSVQRFYRISLLPTHP